MREINYFKILLLSSATVFLRYLNVAKVSFNLDFYYVVNKLIILVPDPH
jgi:hypothetical protein